MTLPRDSESLTQEDVRTLFDYDPLTGIVTRKKELQTPNRHLVGPIVGSKCQGYLRVFVGGRRVKLHRVIWLWMTGTWPSCVIDHINGIRDDNRWENLRDVSVSKNAANRVIPSKRSRSGVVGVYWHEAKKRYRACIVVDGKEVYIGSYKEKADAESARKQALAAVLQSTGQRGEVSGPARPN